MSTPDVTVRRVVRSDQQRWAELFAGYRGFYALGVGDEAVARTWEWVLGEQHGMTGLVAVSSEGDLVGLANLRTFARPSTGTLGLYLDDLFADPAARRKGVGTALLEAAAELAAQRGATVVRWITAGDNARARALYDQHATATPWITYDMPPAAL
jgi:GNAT superfamily N-acetyltransferase